MLLNSWITSFLRRFGRRGTRRKAAGKARDRGQLRSFDHSRGLTAVEYLEDRVLLSSRSFDAIPGLTLTTDDEPALDRFQALADQQSNAPVSFTGEIQYDRGGQVTIGGTFTFTRGTTQSVDVATGLPPNFTDIVAAGGANGEALQPLDDAFSAFESDGSSSAIISADRSSISNLLVTTITFSATNATASVGREGLGEFSITGMTLAGLMMTPAEGALPGFSESMVQPSFYAVKGDGGTASLVTQSGLDLSIVASDVELNLSGGSWGNSTVDGLTGLIDPVIDYVASFPARLLEYDTSQNGQLDVIADSLPSTLSDADLASNGGNGNGIVTMPELLAFYDATGQGGNGDSKLDVSDDAALATLFPGSVPFTILDVLPGGHDSGSHRLRWKPGQGRQRDHDSGRESGEGRRQQANPWFWTGYRQRRF